MIEYHWKRIKSNKDNNKNNNAMKRNTAGKQKLKYDTDR
jgi:hypothetical protein